MIIILTGNNILVIAAKEVKPKMCKFVSSHTEQHRMFYVRAYMCKASTARLSIGPTDYRLSPITF